MRNPGIILLGVLMSYFTLTAQKDKPAPYWDFNGFGGSILLHNPDISHLITGHPRGFIAGMHWPTSGNQQWETTYGYPDTGLSVIYQDMANPTLGHNLGIYAHYNFYFFKRALQFRIGQGIAYTTNPYDRETNFRNNAYGTQLLSSTYLMLQFRKQRLIGALGLQGGLSLVHYSNANFRAPNTSTNTLGISLGINYTPMEISVREPTGVDPEIPDKQLRWNIVFRGGVNESDIVGSGQYPFYILSAYADKRIGKVSRIQLGTELFHSNFLKELIRFRSISFPELQVDGDTDFKRAGIFLGHELLINKLSVVTQLGYYYYYPFDFEGRVYNRVGLKRQLNASWFLTLSLKSHGAKAEALEFGLGIRL